MTIIEAIKSGKKFRRKGWSYFIDVEELESFYYRSEDILTDDWEVEEKKVIVTDTDFEAAVNRTTKSFSIYNPPHICEYLSQLKKELGL